LCGRGASPRGVIPAFDPIAGPNEGDRDRPDAVLCAGPCRTKRVRIPPQGVRATAASRRQFG
jgi:hypothetical protein